MTDIEDLADIVDQPPLDRSHVNLKQAAAGLKGHRKGVLRIAQERRQWEHYYLAPVTLPKLKFLEGSDE